MPRRILCKFFMHGEHCEFSHDWNDPEKNVCTFYQRGNCSYGNRCRYEHVKLSRPLTYEVPSSASFHQSLLSDSGSLADPSRSGNNEAAHAFRDGSLEEVSLRHLGAEDGITVITKDISAELGGQQH